MSTFGIVLVVILVVLLVFFLAMCYFDSKNRNKGSKNVKYMTEYEHDEDDIDEEDNEDDEDERFYYIDSEDVPGYWDNTFNIYVDKVTRVQYIELNDSDGLTVLIDADGKPILYTGNFDEEIREDENDENEEVERFYYIDSEDVPDYWDNTFNIYVDKVTRVQYIDYNTCGLTAYIGPDGKPILYTGDFD